MIDIISSLGLETLSSIWFLIFGSILIGYSILDGFDLGVGMLHLFTRKDNERRILLNSIGPVWDGNEVWLVVAGGALFAGFPEAYATLFSGFYLIMISLLFGLIFRAVAIEFRSKVEKASWRSFWDGCFALGSFLIAFILGLLLGHLIQGVPLDSSHEFIPEKFYLFTPFPIMVGITAVALFSMHGAIFLTMKTEGELYEKVCRWVNPTIIFFVISYATVTMATLIFFPHMVASIKTNQEWFILPFINMLLIANIPRMIHKGLSGWAFLSSCGAITCLILLYSVGTFPYLIRSSVETATNSLDVVSASSTSKTLAILMIIVAIGIPLVISYTYVIYRVFRGKVKLNPMSY